MTQTCIIEATNQHVKIEQNICNRTSFPDLHASHSNAATAMASTPAATLIFLTVNATASPVKVPTDAVGDGGLVLTPCGCWVTAAGGVVALGGGNAGAVNVLVDVLWPEGGGATPAGGGEAGAVPLATGSIAAAIW